MSGVGRLTVIQLTLTGLLSLSYDPGEMWTLCSPRYSITVALCEKSNEIVRGLAALQVHQTNVVNISLITHFKWFCTDLNKINQGLNKIKALVIQRCRLASHYLILGNKELSTEKKSAVSILIVSNLCHHTTNNSYFGWDYFALFYSKIHV